MKKLTSVILFGTALALSACGGDSDSSGESYTSSYKKVFANGNEYSCPTKTAYDACTGDTTCKAAKCELTKEVTTPTDTTTSTACLVNGKTVTGVQSKSCKFADTAANANMVITCDGNKMQLDGNIGNFNSSGSTFSSGLNVGGYKLICP